MGLKRTQPLYWLLYSAWLGKVGQVIPVVPRGMRPCGEENQSGGEETQFLVPGLALSGCVTLGTWLDFSVSESSLVQRRKYIQCSNSGSELRSQTAPVHPKSASPEAHDHENLCSPTKPQSPHLQTRDNNSACLQRLLKCMYSRQHTSLRNTQ